jgi:hypothetical protein
MKALHAVLICLIIFAIFNYTAAAPRPLIQQDNTTPKEKTALHNSPNVSPKGKPSLITLGDPVYDPIPH